jgi:hypothetical protein
MLNLGTRYMSVVSFTLRSLYPRVRIPLYVGFEVFTAVVMKSIIVWDMTPCSAYLLVSAELISSTPKMEAICSSYTSVDGLHGVISQKMILFNPSLVAV